MRPPFTKALQTLALLFGVIALLGSTAGVASATHETSAEASTTQLSNADNEDWDCNEEEWHFILNLKPNAGGTAADVPDHITVTWDDGSEVNVPLIDQSASSTNFHYTTTENLGAGLATAFAEIDPALVNTFVISHGPCGDSGGSSGDLECPEGYSEPDGDLVDEDGNGVAENCVFEPVEAECPEGFVEGDETPMDTDGDGDADNCVEVEETVNVPNIPVTNTVTCPDGSVITEDMNGDDVLNTEDCNEVLDEVEEPTPDTPVAPAEPTTPGEPGTPAEPATPASPAPVLEVKPVAVTPVAAPAAANNPRVLGSQVTRSSQLPRTGDETTNLVPFGLGLVLLGFGLQRTSKRFSAARAS